MTTLPRVHKTQTYSQPISDTAATSSGNSPKSSKPPDLPYQANTCMNSQYNARAGKGQQNDRATDMVLYDGSKMNHLLPLCNRAFIVTTGSRGFFRRSPLPDHGSRVASFACVSESIHRVNVLGTCLNSYSLLSKVILPRIRVMSRRAVDAFVDSAADDTLTPEGVRVAVVTKHVPVNGRRSSDGCTALLIAVTRRNRELVAALLAAGADANVKDRHGRTSVVWGAFSSTVDILQLLIDSGGSVNVADNDGVTPLISLTSFRHDCSYIPGELGVLLACSDLDLDGKCQGRTAEEWAMKEGRGALAAAIAAEVGAGLYFFPSWLFP